jgi:hypothetical protein
VSLQIYFHETVGIEFIDDVGRRKLEQSSPMTEKAIESGRGICFARVVFAANHRECAGFEFHVVEHAEIFEGEPHGKVETNFEVG